MGVLFAAIDPSISCTAISLIKTGEDGKFELIDKVSLLTKKTKYKSRWKKKTDMFDLWKFYLDQYIDEISFFVFENYSYGSIGHLADLGELNGMFKKYISDNDKSFDVIAPSSVKKLITDNGRASKELVRDQVKEKLVDGDKIKFNNLDESDSAAIGVAYAIKMLKEIENGSEQD